MSPRLRCAVVVVVVVVVVMTFSFIAVPTSTSSSMLGNVVAAVTDDFKSYQILGKILVIVELMLTKQNCDRVASFVRVCSK